MRQKGKGERERRMVEAERKRGEKEGWLRKKGKGERERRMVEAERKR